MKKQAWLLISLWLAFGAYGFADTLIDETFDEPSTAFQNGDTDPTAGYAPGSTITGTSAIVVIPQFNPASTDTTQPYVELLSPTSGIDGFTSAAVDINSVGLQFTFSLTTLDPEIVLSFDSAIDNSDVRKAFAYIYSASAPTVPILELTGPSTTSADTVYNYTSPTENLGAGDYILQFSSDAADDFRGVQLDNIVLTSVVPEPAPVVLVMLGLGLVAAWRLRGGLALR